MNKITAWQFDHLILNFIFDYDWRRLILRVRFLLLVAFLFEERFYYFINYFNAWIDELLLLYLILLLFGEYLNNFFAPLFICNCNTNFFKKDC